MADVKSDEQKARDGVKRVLLDLLKSDDDVKLAIMELNTAPSDPLTADGERRVVTLIEEHTVAVARMQDEAVERIVRNMFRKFMRPDAINGTYATELYRGRE